MSYQCGTALLALKILVHQSLCAVCTEGPRRQ